MFFKIIFLTVSLISHLSFAQITPPRQPNFGTSVKTQVKMNSFFCRCDETEKSFNLIRVDISQGKKFETQIRSFDKESFVLAQCEGFINDHPSCK